MGKPFTTTLNNLKGGRSLQEKVNKLTDQSSNREVKISKLDITKVTINKESDDNNNAILDVSGNVVINGDVSGDINFSGNIRFDSSYGILLPRGDISSAVGIDEGTIRYNTEDNIFEGFSLGNWRGLGGVRNVDGDTFINADTNGVLNFVTKDKTQMLIDACGNITIEEDVTLNGTILNYSDRNLKENLKVLTNSLDNIDKINGYSYTRNDVINVHQRHLGVIAQEVETILPELVYEHDKSKIKSVNYNGLIPMLIECVKELKLENKELKERVNNTEQLLKMLVEKKNN